MIFEDELGDFLKDVFSHLEKNGNQNSEDTKDNKNNKNNKGKTMSEKLILNANRLKECSDLLLQIKDVNSPLEGFEIMQELNNKVQLIDFDLLEDSDVFNSEIFKLDLVTVRRVNDALADIDSKELENLILTLKNMENEDNKDNGEPESEDEGEYNDETESESEEDEENEVFVLSLDDIEVEVDHINKTINISNPTENNINYQININS